MTFHGWVGEGTRDRILARARVLALPSVREGWGIAVTEAAAQGTPTIGYRSSGGLTESVVDGVTGWLVEDEAGLRQALEDVLSGRLDTEAAGAAARDRAATLDWHASVRAFEEVLVDVAARAAGARRVSAGRRR